MLRDFEKINQFQIPTHYIEVEVTEHMLGDRGSEYVIRALNKLKQHGVRIALDDFGTGFSSLTHIRDYPIDSLKVDCSFIQKMQHDPSIYAIVQAIGFTRSKFITWAYRRRNRNSRTRRTASTIWL